MNNVLKRGVSRIFPKKNNVLRARREKIRETRGIAVINVEERRIYNAPITPPTTSKIDRRRVIFSSLFQRRPVNNYMYVEAE